MLPDRRFFPFIPSFTAVIQHAHHLTDHGLALPPFKSIANDAWRRCWRLHDGWQTYCGLMVEASRAPPLVPSEHSWTLPHLNPRFRLHNDLSPY